LIYRHWRYSSFTEGDDNTPIAMFDDLHTTKKHRLLEIT
jgi:hypothetical protein